MAIDTATKRRSAAGVAFLPLGPGVTPDAAKGEPWRRSAGWGYSGVETPNAPVVTLLFRLKAARRLLFSVTAIKRLLFRLKAARRLLFAGRTMTPSDASVRIGDENVALVVQFLDQAGTAIDISTASTLQIRIRKRVDGVSTVVTKTAILDTDGTDGKARYVSVAGDFENADPGWWEIEGYAVIGATKITTDQDRFPVLERLTDEE